MKLKPYAAYKESAIPWFGAVPVHWETHTLRSVMTDVTERNRPDLPLLSVVREKGIVLRDVENKEENHNYIPDDLSNYKVVRKGQFAMNKMKAWQGSYGVSPYDGIVSPAYFVFEIDGVGGSFLHRAIRSKAYVPFFAQASDGVRIGQWDLSRERMKEIPLFVPPPAEQHAIARYLDYMDRRINRYIRAKRKLIKLLEEQKQAIIHQAVTRGLDPDAEMRPSGVEWLGDVPAHWEVMRIKHLARVGNGSTPSRGNALYWHKGTYPWLNSSVVNQEVIVDSEQFVTSLALKECHLPIVRPGSILIAITGQGKTRGMSAKLMIEATINQHLAYVTPKKGSAYSDYLHVYLEAAYQELRRISDESGSTRGALTCEDVKQFKVTLPPLNEQIQIAEFIRKEVDGIEIALSQSNQQIDLIREYRIRLVADVVTGKLDVREAVTSLPDELSEPDDMQPDEDLEEDFDVEEEVEEALDAD